MKKLILMFIMVPCIKAMDEKIKTCRDVLSQLKAGAPYASLDAATLRAAEISVAADKMSRDPFIGKNERQDATRRADCAHFFSMAGIYYTNQIELEALDIKFVEQQKNNPAVTKKEFLATYLKDKKTDEKATVSSLMMATLERKRSNIASTQEKAIGQEWNSVLQGYNPSSVKNASQPAQDASQPAKNTHQSNVDAEKYL
jgi:hypothetical protein